MRSERPETWEQYQQRLEMEKRVRAAVRRAIRCIPPITLKAVRAAFRRNDGSN